MAAWAEFAELPLLAVASYLAPRDVCQAAQVCRSWHSVLVTDTVWRPLCASLWMNKDVLPGKTYFHTFAYFQTTYAAYPRYMVLRRIWLRILEWVNQHATDVPNGIRNSLEPGVPLEFLSSMKPYLQPDHMLLLHWANGQKPKSAGLLGTYEFYDFRTNLALCGTAAIDAYRSAIPRELPFLQLTAQQMVPLASSSRTGQLMVLPSGQVVRPLMDWRQALIEAPSILEYLDQYANDLQRGMYVMEPSTCSISLWPSLGRAEAVTRGVKISVGVKYIPERSAQGQSTFAYHVRISMDKDCTLPACVLLTRHWRIRDGNENSEVNGPGVIGQYPKVHPGSDFMYCSCSVAHRNSGYMEGHFRFRDTNGEEFDATVPRFHLSTPVDKLLNLEK